MVSRMFDRRWLIVVLASSSFFMSYFVRLSWAVLAPYSSFSPTKVENGAVFSVFFVGYVISQLPAGLLSDRTSPKLIVSLSMLGLCASSLLGGLASSIRVEIVASFAMGIAAGLIYAPTVKMISSTFTGKQTSVAMGYYSLAWPLPLVLAGFILPPIATSIGWRSAYYGIALFSAVIAVLVGTTNIRSSPSPRFNFSVLRERNVMLLAAGGFMFYLGYWILALYAYEFG